MAQKIRLLFLSASPVDIRFRLRLDEEIREISREIRSSPYGYLFEISSEWAVRPKDLHEALVINRPHIIHFSGHGTRSKGIMLEDNSGKMIPMPVQGFVDLLGILRGNIRLVFLNVCYTKRHADLLSGMIDYTIGIRTKISDKGAILFSSSFYKGLGMGLSVKTAFDLAHNQLVLQGMGFTGSPVLSMREGVKDTEPLVVLSQHAVAIPILREDTPSIIDGGTTGSLLEPTRGAELTFSDREKAKQKTKKKSKQKKKNRNKKLATYEQAEFKKILQEIRSDLKELLARQN